MAVLVGAQPLAVLIPDYGKHAHSVWILTWNLKDAQCLFILLQNIMQKKQL